MIFLEFKSQTVKQKLKHSNYNKYGVKQLKLQTSEASLIQNVWNSETSSLSISLPAAAFKDTRTSERWQSAAEQKPVGGFSLQHFLFGVLHQNSFTCKDGKKTSI